MKKGLSLFLSLVICLSILTSVPLNVNAASIDVLTFELNGDGQSYSVTDCDTSASGELVIPSTYNGLPVTSIGEWSFYSCESLTSIKIPNSATSIGEWSFYSCDSLASIIIPNSVTSIGNEAFSYCTSLTSVTIPESVTSIGAWAFEDCTSLKAINIDENNTNYLSVNGVLFNKDKTKLIQYPAGKTDVSYAIANSVTNIGDGAFADCESLKSLTIAESVTYIGMRAFADCTGLEIVNWNAKNATLFWHTAYVFSSAGKNGSGIDFVFGDSVEKIPFNIFSVGSSGEEPNIKTVIIGKGVKNVDEVGFSCCGYLTSIIVDEKNTDFRSVDGVLFNKDKTTLIRYPTGKTNTSYTIPDSVTSIGDMAFDDCTSLTSITIPHSVISIGGSAFNQCTNLSLITVDTANENYSSVAGVLFNKDKTTLIKYPAGKINTSYKIPDGVTSIGDYAFDSCYDLTSVTIPDSVTSIGNSAFDSCHDLTSITIPNSVTSIGDSAFNSCYALTGVYITDLVSWCNIEFKTSFSNPLCYADNLYLNGELVTDVVIPYGATTIPEYAFSCDSLTSVTIPNSVKGICDYAFYNCENLTSITIGKGVTSIGGYTFNGCNSLTDIIVNSANENYSSVAGVLFNKDKTTLIKYPVGKTNTSYKIPDGVTSIGNYAFYSCYDLTSVTIGDSVTSIGDYAFDYCINLTSVAIGDSVTSIGNSAFYSCYDLTSVTIGDSVTSIGNSAFYSCYDLTSITIPNSVTSIGGSAFDYCPSLTSITIPDSVSSIGGYAFNGTAYYNDSSNWENDILYIGNHLIKAKESIKGAYKIKPGTKTIANSAFSNCESLTSVTIPDSVTSIGDYAFSDCKSLTSIRIPHSVISIGGSAFNQCTNLSLITVDTANENYSSVAGVLFNKDKTTLIKYPAGKINTSYKIPDGVTSIGDYAFYSCYDLASITIPNSVTSIGDYAFCACTSLTSITIPDSVTSVGGGAFNSCTSLTSITIPDGVTSISYVAFHSCSNLISVTIPDSVKSIAPEAFSGCDRLNYIFYGGTQTDKNNMSIGYGNFELESIVWHYEATGHTISDWKTDKEATVYKAGSKHKECDVCGEIIETATIAQLKCTKPVLKKVYNANSYVKVTWGTVKGADKYYVYRKTGTEDYECIGSTTNKYFNDKNAPAGKTCRYRIRAKNEAGYSPYSDSLAIKHLDEPNLKSIENSEYGVLIKWGKVTGAQKYNVYRKVSGGEYKYIGATTNAYYTDKTAKSGKKYYYAIRGKRDDSVSSQSASLSKYYLADPTLNTPSTTTKGVGLRWSKVTGAEGYMVYRRTANGSYKLISTEKGVSNVTFRDTTAKKGTKYYYKVKAYKSKTYSAYSNTKAITDKY